jgi:tetratricopeptide (TPR) repeat protein
VRLEQLTPATRYQSLLDEAVKAYASKTGVSQSDIDAARIMEKIAQARLYQRQGRLDDAIAQLDFAASLQDHMDYDEPPHWMTPVGQTLGALKIAKGDWNGAIKAFRDSLGLDQTPGYNPYTNFRGNGWAYYGLTVAYQKKKLNGGLTPKEQTDYDAAKSDLKQYWTGEGLAPSLLDRM